MVGGKQLDVVVCTAMAATCVSFINNAQIYLSTYAFELFSFQVSPVESAPVSAS